MRYYEIIEKLGLTPWWGEFLRTNTANRLPYHNVQHTIFMIEDAYAGALAEGLAPALMKGHILAAMFHDFDHTGGYFYLNPKLVAAKVSAPEPDSVNILHACVKVRSMLEKGFWPSGVSLDAVLKAIRATQYPYEVEPETQSGRILRDADVLTYARPTFLYMNVLGLALELNLTLDGRPDLMKAFLGSIQQGTEWGKARWAEVLPGILAETDAFTRAWTSGLTAELLPGVG